MNINLKLALRDAAHKASEAAIIANALPEGAYRMDDMTMRGPATWVFTDSGLATLVFEMKGN